MSKVHTAPRESKHSEVSTRVLTKKKIANYSYILTDVVGQGYSSKVYKGVNQLNNCPVAIKAIDMARINNEIHQVLLQSEIECLKKFTRAQNVIQFFDVHATRNNTYIMTQFCQEGDLAKLITPQGMNESQAIVFMKQIIAGYLEIYKKGIVHRDLKPANIFIKDRVLKIADFGFAVRIQDTKKSNKYNIGSPLYMPPEALLYNQYSYKSDIWALGIIFYQLLTGAAPWNAKTQKQLANKIMSDNISRIMPSYISSESADFLRRMLQCSINDRMTPEQLKNFVWSTKQPHQKSSLLKNSNRVSCYDPQRQSSPKTTSTNATQVLTLPPLAAIIEDEYKLTEVSRKQISKQLLAQIHLCRFLYKLIKRMELVQINTQKLEQELTGVIFHKLHILNSCECTNPFAIQRFKQYRQSSDFSKFLTVAKQYQSKYRDELGRYINVSWRQNYENILQEIRCVIDMLYQLLKHIEHDEAPIHKDQIILIDYLITTYQLIQLASRGDVKEFSKKSKIQTIVEGQPASINYSHFKAVEQKLVLLAFI